MTRPTILFLFLFLFLFLLALPACAATTHPDACIDARPLPGEVHVEASLACTTAANVADTHRMRLGCPAFVGVACPFTEAVGASALEDCRVLLEAARTCDELVASIPLCACVEVTP